jgi:nucleoside phosphorylase/predicted nucleotidyltransferase
VSEQQPLDLYNVILSLGQTEWIEEIRIFGSRRYLSNASYGSDIDLLVVTNRSIQTDKLRALIREQYIDAFLLDGTLAISAANETRINLAEGDGIKSLDAVALWSRAAGWLTGEDYRILDIIPDKVPAMTMGTAGARPVILFCALPSEFDAVKSRMGEGTQKSHARIPPYYRAYLKTQSGRERLVVAVQTGVAGVNAGISATRILDYFDQPQLAVLVGITAGLKDEKFLLNDPKAAQLGDILVPTATVDVEAGKLTPKGKEPAGQTLPMAANYQRSVASWNGCVAWAARWKRVVNGVECPPKIFADCTLACTASVIAYDDFAQSLKQRDRKIAGIEMEAVGVAMACAGRCDFLVVKSISDWADENKADSQHSYCTRVSADLVLSMIEDETL